MDQTPRRRSRLLACGAALALLPALAPPAYAADEVKLDQTKKTFIVQMKGDPVATYDGGVQGIPATKPATGKKVNAKSGNAKKLEAHNRNEQRKAVRDANVKESAKTHEFTVAFNGFTAKLTEAEAAVLKKAAGVANVWEDEVRYADTVTTPDYLGLSGKNGVWAKQFGGDAKAGTGIVVGVLDTGIDPDNPSFAALPGAKMPAGDWACETENDPTFKCTTKIVGARYYGTEYENDIRYDFNSPRDTNGHGSHTAGTAAGNHGVAMSIQGNTMGSGSGMAPAAHVAVYKALWQTEDGRGSGTSSGLVQAIDDAVADGVDVINYSVSGSSEYVVTADELAFMAAAEAGVFVSTSAGNSGDSVGVSSVAHNSPWTMTVAASSHDRGVENTLTTGDGTTYDGVGYGGPTAQLPMVLASTIPAAGYTAAQADLCGPGTVDDAGAAGKMVVCTRGEHPFVDKGAEVAASGGAAIVVANSPTGASTLLPIIYSIPGFHLTAEDGEALKAYVSDQDAPTGAINASKYVEVDAPSMASFSSFGPALAGGGDLLKPDITAPGVDVIAAYSQDPDSGDPRFESLQGTSMSAPHIAGLGALLKQRFPTWSPMAIKSAMMTTARQTTDEGKAILTATGAKATPLNYGAGEVVPAKSYNPGLVYDSNITDWDIYACGIGQLQLVGGAEVCAQLPAKDPSDLNYPSISIGELTGTQTITRTVKNVNKSAMQYRAKVEAPKGTTVKVVPDKITVRPGGSATFKVTITRTDAALGKYTFGSLTWVPNSPKYETVRSPIAVKPMAVSAPVEVTGTGTSGATDITVTPGFTGTLKTDVDGLIPSDVVAQSVVREDGTPLDGYFFWEVTKDTKVSRFATYDEEVAAKDIDLYVYRFNPADSTVSLVDLSGNEGSSEELTLRLAPGIYVVSIDLYSPEPSVSVPVHTWDVTDADADNLTVQPASASVTMAQPVTFTAAWSGLTAGQRYLGQVNFLEGDTPAGSTLVTVNP